MPDWLAFPHRGEFKHSAQGVKKLWARLHAGDRQAVPREAKTFQAWALFHNGQFQEAAQMGQQLGGEALAVTHKATSVYANYLEPDPDARLRLYLEVAECAERMTHDHPADFNAWYWQAYALGRYSQDISVAKALAQGLGTRVREALEHTIHLEPLHADAHVALGAFHAEVIDKVGALIGSMTYGAKKDVGLKHYQTALLLNPSSAFAMVEYANALVMMDGDKRTPEATRWYRKAAASEPLDAMERLDVELAKRDFNHA